MPKTLIDAPTALQRTVVIDVRQYLAVGDGIHDDTPNIQNAINAAGAATLVSGLGANPSVIVQFPVGKFRTTSTLTFPHDGVILQGVGMMGFGNTQVPGSTDNLCSILYAGTGSTHSVSPMVRMSSADGPGGTQWYRGTCIRNLSIDVSGSSSFQSGFPQPVLQIQGLSNCPQFENINIYGNIGTAIDISPRIISSSVQAICENLRFVNCFLCGGYSSSGGSVNTMPTAPGIVITGSDNIQFIGGFCVYFFGSLFTTGSTAGPAVNNNLTDVPAIKIIPNILGNGFIGNYINNGVVFENFFITNYVVSARISNVVALDPNTSLSAIFCPAFCVFRHFCVENYNKVFQCNQENTSNAGFWRTRLFVRDCLLGGGFAGYGGNAVSYPPYATSAFQVQASNLVGGRIELQSLFRNPGAAGDLFLDATCTGVTYKIGPHPSTLTFFSGTDLGTNDGEYTKNGFAGRMFNGTVRILGTTDPATTNSGTGVCALQAYGDTAQITASARNIPSTFSPGNFGEMCIGQPVPGPNWFLYFCVAPNNWVRLAAVTF